MTRDEYLISPTNNHSKYYSQYVNQKVKNLLIQHIGFKILKNNKQNNFFNISKNKWQSIINHLDDDIKTKFIYNNDTFSYISAICVLKQAAREILDGI